ncbi:hypothetical protein [Corynebacterium diphtheriae]|uniref:hypothetical protein n=1 Tax=Corynebacterium diphtheriae TaxID=1717 RepID=UPI000A1D85AC|nr:hypothetical protein [Corynebacterium diphtheriae]OSQ14653.1 hypothetical protein B1A57_03975 [Corynebacterium diphtheriae]
MAITLKQAIKAAALSVGGADRLEATVKYGPLSPGFARMYEFSKADKANSGLIGYVGVVVIDEQTGENIASSAFPGLGGGDYELLDFDGNVIRTRKEVHAAWEAEQRQDALEAESESSEFDEPIPVLVQM